MLATVSYISTPDSHLLLLLGPALPSGTENRFLGTFVFVSPSGQNSTGALWEVLGSTARAERYAMRSSSCCCFHFITSSSIWDLSSLTRNWTCSPCRILTTGPPRKFWSDLLHTWDDGTAVTNSQRTFLLRILCVEIFMVEVTFEVCFKLIPRGKEMRAHMAQGWRQAGGHL